MVRKQIYSIIITTLCVFTLLAQNSENIELLARWNDYSIPTNGFHVYNDVWGFEYLGEEYACIGSTAGTHVFQVPENHHLNEVAFIPGRFQGSVIHRDFAFYEGYLYAVCDQGSSSLQVIDLRNIPYKAELVYDDTTYVKTAHNVTVDPFGKKLYVSGPTGGAYDTGVSGAAMKVFDISVTPHNPELLIDFTEVEYVHDAYVRRDTAYLSCGTQGFFIYDFSDDLNPQILSSIDNYPQDGYNHSGWLNGSGSHFAFADETPSLDMKILDVTDLTDIQVVDLFNSELNLPDHLYDPQTMAHNIEWVGNTIYVSHYFDGLQVFDATDPTDIKSLAYYDTHPSDPIGGRGAWGVKVLPSGRILISDREAGLFLVRLIEVPSESNLLAYPNPNGGHFCINLTNCDFTEGAVILYDSSGSMVSSKIIHKSDIETQIFKFEQGLKAGVYYYKLELDGVLSETQKLVVE